MVKKLSLFGPIFAMIGFFANLAFATEGVIINEAMINTPTSEQWIELYNNSPWGVSLDGMHLEMPSRVITFPDGLILQPFEYFIVCRQLFDGSGGAGFETVWGNGTGVWGDGESEVDLQTPFQALLNMISAYGYVALYDSTNAKISEITWNREQPSKTSIERVRPDSTRTVYCEDLRGGTPFTINSVTPFGRDLALRRPTVSSSRGKTNIVVPVKNTGVKATSGAILTLLDAVSNDVVETIPIADLNPGDSIAIVLDGMFTGVYVELAANIPNDDRTANNSVAFTAPGERFPPFALSEIAPIARDEIKTEWIELRKTIDEPWDLMKWQLSVGNSMTVIAPYTELISDNYLILTESRMDFLASYPSVTAPVLELPGWQALTNTGSTIRLIDPYGIEADQMSYPGSSNIIVWSRDNADDPHWGVSSPPVGSPGAPNQVLSVADSSVSMSIEDRIIDGSSSDAIGVNFTAPPGAKITFKIFDRGGRLIATLFEDSPISERYFEWNCRNSSGEQLPIGIYIAFLEVDGKETVKQTIVIAR